MEGTTNIAKTYAAIMTVTVRFGITVPGATSAADAREKLIDAIEAPSTDRPEWFTDRLQDALIESEPRHQIHQTIEELSEEGDEVTHTVERYDDFPKGPCASEV